MSEYNRVRPVGSAQILIIELSLASVPEEEAWASLTKTKGVIVSADCKKYADKQHKQIIPNIVNSRMT